MINLLNGSAIYQITARFLNNDENKNDNIDEYHYLNEKNFHFSTRLKNAVDYITTTAFPLSIIKTTNNYESSLEIQSLQNSSLPFVVNPNILGISFNITII